MYLGAIYHIYISTVLAFRQGIILFMTQSAKTCRIEQKNSIILDQLFSHVMIVFMVKTAQSETKIFAVMFMSDKKSRLR